MLRRLVPLVSVALLALACSSSSTGGNDAGATPVDSGTNRDGDGSSFVVPANTVPVPIGASPVRGPADAWVTMIEFGDFECPFCGDEEQVVEALLAAYPTDLRLVFKNFPLTTIHPFAEGAAIAAECANDQGDFWPMHDVLYANQTALQSANLPTYAQTAGVADLPTWQACLTTQPPVDAIDADVTLGTSVGVGGTPTFFVNGQVVVGAVPQAQLQAAIESARSAAEASGVARADYYNTVILGN